MLRSASAVGGSFSAAPPSRRNATGCCSAPARVSPTLLPLDQVPHGIALRVTSYMPSAVVDETSPCFGVAMSPRRNSAAAVGMVAICVG